jgi:NAD(P)-dependent dehydrogenase (short-subunit alcohol dehydrogenase family)
MPRDNKNSAAPKSGNRFSDMPRDDGNSRITLVTGASRGIGRAAAVALAGAGHHVICLARDGAGLEATDDAVRAAGGTATLVSQDLRDFSALDRLGASIFERWGRLDGFLANAGVLGPLSPVAHLDPLAFAELIAVNVTANARAIRALDPLLRASEAGRAVFLSSTVARKPRAYWGGYAMSKAALESLALTYAAECESTNVRVNVLNPGATATTMRAEAMPGEDPSTLPTPQDIAPLIVKMLSAGWEGNGACVNARE